MKDKQLKNKAINIKGKDYVMVKDRIIYFNEKYPKGRITTKMLDDNGERVIMKAYVIPDTDNQDRYFTGISASNPSKSIELQVPYEVAETSAVGRALAMMGIGVIDAVASADEISKAGITKDETATPNQINYILKLGNKIGKSYEVDKLESMTKSEASQEIERMREELENA